MKATKIVLGIAVAAAVVFTSCKDMGGALGTVPISEDTNKNAKTKAEVTGTVNYENTSKDMARGMKLFSNKKKGIVLKFQLQDLTTDKQNPGLLGLVFDMEKNKDETYNFVIFGMKNSHDKNPGSPKYYITYYRNISESAFSSSDFGVKKGNHKEVKDHNSIDASFFFSNEPVAVDIVDWTELTAITRTKDNTLNLGICVQPLKASKDDTDEGEVNADYAYNIYLYNADDDNVTKLGTVKEPTKSKSGDQDISENMLNNGNPIPISRKLIGAGEWEQNGTFKPSSKKLQGQMGFYANVYENRTLKGEWQVADIQHEPNLSRVAESNQDNPLNIQISY